MNKVLNTAVDVQGLAANQETTETGTMSNVQVNNNLKESTGRTPKVINGKVVNPFDCDKYVEKTQIGDMEFKVFKFFRVTKHSGLKIMYARVGEVFYGGMRYLDSTDEESLCSKIANLVMDGKLCDETNSIKLHVSLGRKVEMLDTTILLNDFYF